MIPPTVELRGLVKRFGRRTVLDHLDLDIAPGVTGLLGPNGAGKTTLLRVVATVLAPDAGEVRLLGRDPDDAADRVAIRRRLGYLPQEPGYPPRFTAAEFVDHIAILKEWTDTPARRAEVRRVLELVGLGDVGHKRIRTLSGGMRRRVGLAQALLGLPDLVVLDEPTAGLDPEQRMRFREILSGVGATRTVVVSTHQTEDVAALCQRVVVVDEGSVRFTGTPGQLAALADGHVWIDDTPAPHAWMSIRTADGHLRHLGEAPSGAELVTPTIEEGYLLLRGADRVREVVA